MLGCHFHQWLVGHQLQGTSDELSELEGMEFMSRGNLAPSCEKRSGRLTHAAEESGCISC